MTFFGDISKKFTDAGRNVAQHTKDFASITRMNSALSGLQAKQREQFQSLGRAYYERHKDDTSAENRAILDAITETSRQIQQATEQIAALRGYEKCPQCGASIPNNAQYCSVCGAKMEREQAGSNRSTYCMNCGAELEAGSRFCVVCGAKVPASDESSVQTDATPHLDASLDDFDVAMEEPEEPEYGDEVDFPEED